MDVPDLGVGTKEINFLFRLFGCFAAVLAERLELQEKSRDSVMSSLFGDVQLSALSLQLAHTNALQETTSCVEKKNVSCEIPWKSKWQIIPPLKHLKKLHSTEGKGQETD